MRAHDEKIGLVLALLTMSCEEKRGATLTGLLDAEEVDVAARLPGRVTSVLVEEGEAVQEGQPLVRLELDALEARFAEVTAGVDAAQAQLSLVKSGARPTTLNAASAAVRAAEQEVETAGAMAERARTLVDQKAMGKAQYDQLHLAHELAKAQLEVARQHEKALREGARPEEVDTLTALASGAASARDLVASLLKEKEQKAPIAGEVAKVHVHPGELSGIGFPLVTVVDLSEIWATFAVREDHLKDFAKGSTRELFVPALGKKVRGKVSHVSPLGDFATWRATSAADSFDLKSFEVKLVIEPTQLEGLRPGMTVRLTLPSP